MTTLNISLPEDLKKVADELVRRGGYASHSEYVRSLIREDQRRLERESLEAKLLERLAGGDAQAMGPDDFDKIRSRLKAHLAGTRGRRGKGKR